jgi:hypothetical protein
MRTLADLRPKTKRKCHWRTQDCITSTRTTLDLWVRGTKRFAAREILAQTIVRHAQPPLVENGSTRGLRQSSVEAGDSGATLAALCDKYSTKRSS